MEIEELLVAIGVDTTQAAKIKEVVVALGVAATQIANEANKVNENLSDIGDAATRNIEEAANKADGIGNKISKLKLLAIGVGAVIGAVSANVLGFIDSSLAGAKELAKEKGLLFDISQDELRQADEYQAAMKKTGLSIDAIKTKVALNLVPQLTRATRGFNDWLNANKALISNGLTKIILWGAKVIQVVINSVKAINLLIERTIGWKAAIIALSVILAVLKRAMLMAFITNPITWVVAGIIGLMLLLDDLMVYLQGGKSLFGEFWGACIGGIKSVTEWWNGLSSEFKTSLMLIGAMLAATFGTNIFQAVTSGAGLFGKALRLLFSPLGGLTKLLGVASKAVIWLGRAMLMNPIGIIVGLIVGLGYVLYDLYQRLTTVESAFSGFWQAIVDTWEKIKSIFKDGVKDILMSLGMSEEGAERVVNAIGDIFGVIFGFMTYPFVQAWELIKGLFEVWGNDTISFTDKIGKTFELVVDSIKKPFMTAFEFVERYFNQLIAGIKEGIHSVKRFFGMDDDGRVDVSGSFAGSVINSMMQDVNLPSSAGESTNNQSIVINQGDVNVSNSIVSNNPERVGAVVTDAINKNATKLAYNASQSVMNG